MEEVNTVCGTCDFYAHGFGTCDFDIVSKYLSSERVPKGCPTKPKSIHSNDTNGSLPKFIHPSRCNTMEVRLSQTPQFTAIGRR